MPTKLQTRGEKTATELETVAKPMFQELEYQTPVSFLLYFNNDDMDTLIQSIFPEHNASDWEYALAKKRVQTNTRNWKSRAPKNMTVGLTSAIPRFSWANHGDSNTSRIL